MSPLFIIINYMDGTFCDWKPELHGGKPCPKHKGGSYVEPSTITRDTKFREVSEDIEFSLPESPLKEVIMGLMNYEGKNTRGDKSLEDANAYKEKLINLLLEEHREDIEDYIGSIERAIKQDKEQPLAQNDFFDDGYYNYMIAHLGENNGENADLIELYKLIMNYDRSKVFDLVKYAIKALMNNSKYSIGTNLRRVIENLWQI